MINFALQKVEFSLEDGIHWVDAIDLVWIIHVQLIYFDEVHDSIYWELVVFKLNQLVKLYLLGENQKLHQFFYQVYECYFSRANKSHEFKRVDMFFVQVKTIQESISVFLCDKPFFWVIDVFKDEHLFNFLFPLAIKMWF